MRRPYSGTTALRPRLHVGLLSATTDGMPGTNTKLTTAVETYLTELRHARASGGATGERSSYPALAGLLTAVGATLKPKVICVSELADQGAGHPDFGLYAAKQVQKGQPKDGQVPERGVVEVKSAQDDAWLTAESQQVGRYWSRYRLVLVTNTRDFVLVGEDAAGQPATLETLRLARSAARGRKLAALLDPDTPVPGVTTGTLRPDIATIAVPATADGRTIDRDDFALTAGWGHYGTGEAVMPGQGRIVEREYTADERATLVGATGRSPLHRHTTFDIYLNGNAYWRNVPSAVWRYKLGGYQVLKKWLSYRERPVLGRALLPKEDFTEVARRITAIMAITDDRVGQLSEA